MNHNENGGNEHANESAIRHAIKDVKEAEQELEEAHRAEERAEAHLEDALHELEEAEHEKPHTVTIVVNGTPHEVPKNEKITYAQVVTFAHPDYPHNPQITYSVTYTDKGDERILPPGGSVKVKEGMEFLVNRSGQS